MADERQQMIKAIETCLDEMDSLREVLKKYDRMYKHALQSLKSGASFADTVMTQQNGELSVRLTEQLAAFEASRHRSRTLLVTLGKLEGLSLGEISRRWGISRQLVARYASEVGAD